MLEFIIAVAIIASILEGYAKYIKDKRRICDYLYEKGATDVTIAKVWFAGGKYHNVYDVTYTDCKHRHCQNRCKVQSSLFSDGPIYWKGITY